LNRIIWIGRLLRLVVSVRRGSRIRGCSWNTVAAVFHGCDSIRFRSTLGLFVARVSYRVGARFFPIARIRARAVAVSATWSGLSILSHWCRRIDWRVCAFATVFCLSRSGGRVDAFRKDFTWVCRSYRARARAVFAFSSLAWLGHRTRCRLARAGFSTLVSRSDRLVSNRIGALFGLTLAITGRNRSARSRRARHFARGFNRSLCLTRRRLIDPIGRGYGS
jgi:hypothetical protein